MWSNVNKVSSSKSSAEILNECFPVIFHQMSAGNTEGGCLLPNEHQQHRLGAAFVHIICHAYILSGPTVMFLAVYLN